MKKAENAGPGGVAWTPESDNQTVWRRIARAGPGNRLSLRRFAKWLSEERGLAVTTISTSMHYACEFVDAVAGQAKSSCAVAFRRLDASRIERFFVGYSEDHGMAARRNMRAAMRWFLGYAAWRRWVGSEMADAVPSLRSWRLSGLPRGLSEEQVSTLLSSVMEPGSCCPRDRAIVILLVTYGVRAGQVSALRLSDIDWRTRTIKFAPHKRGKLIEHALSASVAEALALYLREPRPEQAGESVFLRIAPPRLRLGPRAISSMVRARMAKAGLAPRGPHALRHSFATRLVRQAQPPKAIADLLGHRSLDSVALYAKVDLQGLLEVATEWPEVLS